MRCFLALAFVLPLGVLGCSGDFAGGGATFGGSKSKAQKDDGSDKDYVDGKHDGGDADAADGPDSGAADQGGDSDSGQADSDTDSTGSQDSGDADAPLVDDDEIEKNGDIVAGWHCQTHFDPNPHEIKLQNFDPRAKNGYTLYVRPPNTHCTGIRLKVELRGTKSGAKAELKCEGSDCIGGEFNYYMLQKAKFRIEADQLKSLRGKKDEITDYELAYTWTSNSGGPGATCDGPNQASYGVGVYLSLNDNPPKSNVAPGFDCSAYNLSP